jgi:hypothetical protein
MAGADKQAMQSFETKEPKEVGGVMLKKFTANAAKQQLIIEYVTGKKSEAPVKKESDAPKKKDAKETASRRRPPSAYDNVKQVFFSFMLNLRDTHTSCSAESFDSIK